MLFDHEVFQIASYYTLSQTLLDVLAMKPLREGLPHELALSSLASPSGRQVGRLSSIPLPYRPAHNPPRQARNRAQLPPLPTPATPVGAKRQRLRPSKDDDIDDDGSSSEAPGPQKKKLAGTPMLTAPRVTAAATKKRGREEAEARKQVRDMVNCVDGHRALPIHLLHEIVKENEGGRCAAQARQGEGERGRRCAAQARQGGERGGRAAHKTGGRDGG